MKVEFDEGELDPGVIVVSGEVDIHTAPRLRQALDALIVAGAWKVVVDLQGVDFIDSSGLRVLLTARRRLEPNGGTLSLVCTQPRVLKVLEITGLLGSFPIYGSTDEARQHLVG
jgi:anti-sigma B factor antagonist